MLDVTRESAQSVIGEKLNTDTDTGDPRLGTPHARAMMILQTSDLEELN